MGSWRGATGQGEDCRAGGGLRQSGRACPLAARASHPGVGSSAPWRPCPLPPRRSQESRFFTMLTNNLVASSFVCFKRTSTE